MRNKIILGFAPTRRNIFSADSAIEFANKTRAKLRKLGIEFIDINDVNDEGLLYEDMSREKIATKFKAAHIDGLFLPHVNFGTEFECARLAREFHVPVLLWGPDNEGPDANGIRLRDSQCGLFATGKVLRRFNVPFTYVPNVGLDTPLFERGIRDFLRVCNVVKVFRHTRILQVGPRPFDFWSTMVNEGELLEKFNIQLSPIPLTELVEEIHNVQAHAVDEVTATMEQIYRIADVEIEQKDLNTVAALKIALHRLADRYGCNAGAIQCWTALQDEIGILPYAAESLLQDEGLPVTCETDIHGAISILMIEAATLGEHRALFADWTVRHPTNKNAELLQHLGVFPPTIAKEKPVMPKKHFVFPYPGSMAFEAQKGWLTLARFDGDHGHYSLLLGNAKVVDGPYNQGSFAWVQVRNLNRLEQKLVYGPYIHHVAAVYDDVVPILAEACKYIGIKADFYDRIDEDVVDYWAGNRNSVFPKFDDED
jgi:L-fucose isomerase-like protein